MLAGESAFAQEYGKRIGRRNRQNFGFKSAPLTIESAPLAAARAGRVDAAAGYSYVPPANPLVLPSSSDHQGQEDHQVTTAIKSQASEVVEQELEAPIEVQEIDSQQIWPLLTADQNLAPVQQPLDDEIAFWDFRESIPGDPEFDYPILDRIPKTSFTCNGQRDGIYLETMILLSS